jgi:hypothetical protein
MLLEQMSQITSVSSIMHVITEKEYMKTIPFKIASKKKSNT